MILPLLAGLGAAFPGLVAAAPAVGSGGLGDVLKGLPDVPNADWPCLLLGVCAGVLGLLALWGLAKGVCSACGVHPPEEERSRRAGGEREGERR